jgi:hypothetical protein
MIKKKKKKVFLVRRNRCWGATRQHATHREKKNTRTWEERKKRKKASEREKEESGDSRDSGRTDSAVADHDALDVLGASRSACAGGVVAHRCRFGVSFASVSNAGLTFADEIH